MRIGICVTHIDTHIDRYLRTNYSCVLMPHCSCPAYYRANCSHMIPQLQNKHCTQWEVVDNQDVAISLFYWQQPSQGLPHAVDCLGVLQCAEPGILSISHRQNLVHWITCGVM